MTSAIETTAVTPENTEDSLIPYNIHTGHAEEPPTKLPKTKGEKIFGVTRFFIAEVVILAATALLAYYDKHHKGPNGEPNFLNRMTKGTSNFLGEKLKLPKFVANSAANMMFLSWGGNIFAPVMLMMDRKKKEIVTYFNEKYSTPEETERAKKTIDQEPKPNLWDVIKGRFTAMVIVMGSFLAADKLLGTDKEGMNRFAKYEDKFGRFIHKLFGDKNSPLPMQETKSYRYGSILALDIYATTASVTSWIAANKFFSALKQKKEKPRPAPSPEVSLAQSAPVEKQEAASENKSWAAGIEQKAPVKPVKSDSHQDSVDARREEMQGAVPAMAY